MSARRLRSDTDRLPSLLRDMKDHLDALTSGTGSTGRTSVGSFRIGQVEIDDAPGSGSDHLIVTDTLTAARVPIAIDGASRVALSTGSASAAVGVALVAVGLGLSLTVTVPAGLATIVDVRLHASIPSAAAVTGTGKIGWLRDGAELARCASLIAAVTCPVSFEYVDRVPAAGTHTYALAALVSAGSLTVGNGADTILVSAALVPHAT